MQLADPARDDARRSAHPDRRRATAGRCSPAAAPRCSPTCANCCATSARVLAEVPNRLTLEGHTDARRSPAASAATATGSSSADRANASRRELLAGGLPDDRVLRVQGLAASQPLRPRTTRRPGQPPHQHRRDEPRGRGARLPRHPEARRTRQPMPQAVWPMPRRPAFDRARAAAVEPALAAALNSSPAPATDNPTSPLPRGPLMSNALRPEIPDRR